MRTALTLIVAIVLAAAGGIGVASSAAAGNPHCAGVSDNINLPSGHVNNFPGCE